MPADAVGDPTSRSVTVPRDVVSVAEWDAALAIDNPSHWTATEAVQRLSPSDEVIGLEVDGEACAYPLSSMDDHLVANDRLGAVPVVVVWHPAAQAASAFVRPEVDGRTLGFGVSGKMFGGALLMYDRQSSSLWSQSRGEAVWGALAGRPMQPLPLVLTTWGSWFRAAPATRALADGAASGDLAADAAAAFVDPAATGPPVGDDVLVTGAVVDGHAAAWSCAVSGGGFVTDRVGSVDILVVCDPVTNAGWLFDRAPGGHALVFRGRGGPALQLMDDTSGATWDAWTGTATDGPGAGARMERLPSATALWSVWRLHHPDTTLRAVPAPTPAELRDAARGG
jgi:hypothetical protein